MRILILALLFIGCTQNSSDTKTVECEARSEATCGEGESCAKYEALNVSTQTLEFLGCENRQRGCGDAETCATSPKNKAIYAFSNTCTPPGFTATKCPAITDADECKHRSEASCMKDAKCIKQQGFNISTQTREFAGCTPPRTSCDESIICAISPRNKSLYHFPSTCIPDGFIQAECPAIIFTTGCKEISIEKCGAFNKCIEAKATNILTQKEEIVGCKKREELCDEEIICATSPKNNGTYRFPSTCLPNDFIPTECPSTP